MATIKDIALRAGVSTSAVSRILNNDTSFSVNPATRQRVLQVAAELNYHKKELDYQSTSIGIFLWCSPFQETEDPYYQNIRLGIEKYCASRHLAVVRAYQGQEDYASRLKGVKGLICIGKFSAAMIHNLEAIAPYVIFADMKTQRISCNTICLDFTGAVEDMMDYLTGLGHKNIAYFGGTERLSDDTVYFEERLEAFTRYCLVHEMGSHIYEQGFSADAGRAMALALLENNRSLPESERITAVFCASDPIAFGAMQAFRETGLSLPKDLSIAGFDNIEMSAYSEPPLTTVNAPTMFMGEYAAHFIHLLCMEGSIPSSTPVRLTLPCGLQIRSSCGPVR